MAFFMIDRSEKSNLIGSNQEKFKLDSIMHSAILIIYFSIFIVVVSKGQSLSKNHFNIVFYGDDTVWNYLKHLCYDFNDKKVAILLLENFIFENEFKYDEGINHQRIVFNYLVDSNCQFDYILKANKTTIENTINEPEPFQYRNILLIFDFLPNEFKKLNFIVFEELLITMNAIYMQCSKCLPFIAIFKQSIKILNEWMIDVVPMLDKRFQCTLVSDSIKQQKVLHLRPIVDGCRLYNGMFEPKTQADFQRLKVSFKKCNLNKTTINVVINDVCSFLNSFHLNLFILFSS